MLPHMPRQGLRSESFMWLGGSLHAAQTFTTSSLICLGSLLIRSISLVWLSFTIFSSLVLYWYWSAMVGLQVLDGQETVRVNLPGPNASVHCWTPVSPLRRSLWHASGQLLQKMEACPPPSTHIQLHTHTLTQCNSCRQKRHALRESPGLCHISHRVVGLTGQGLHSGTNFHQSEAASTNSPSCSNFQLGRNVLHPNTELSLKRRTF